MALINLYKIYHADSSESWDTGSAAGLDDYRMAVVAAGKNYSGSFHRLQAVSLHDIASNLE